MNGFSLMSIFKEDIGVGSEAGITSLDNVISSTDEKVQQTSLIVVPAGNVKSFVYIGNRGLPGSLIKDVASLRCNSMYWSCSKIFSSEKTMDSKTTLSALLASDIAFIPNPLNNNIPTTINAIFFIFLPPNIGETKEHVVYKCYYKDDSTIRLVQHDIFSVYMKISLRWKK